MPIRFQADADLNQIIVSAILRRVPAIDFRTATAAGLAGLNDMDVLALCAQHGRVLVTHDQTTMPRHFGEFVRSNPSPGLIIVLRVPKILIIPFPEILITPVPEILAVWS